MKPLELADDLPRLRDASGSALAAALADLAKRGPDASELASLATQLSLQGLPMTPPAAAPSGAGAARGAGWKLALVGSTAASGVALWWLLHAPAASRPPVPATAQSSVEMAPVSSGSARPLVSRSPAYVVRPAPLASTSLPTDSASAPAETTEPTSATTAVASAQPPHQHAPEPQVVTGRAPSNEGQGPGSVRPGTTTNQADGPLVDPAVPSEMELLRGARLALKGSPAEALRLAQQHQSIYPSGKLTQERELIAISALVALGRRTAALSRAASFERAFPSSPYRKQINELLQ